MISLATILFKIGFNNGFPNTESVNPNYPHMTTYITYIYYMYITFTHLPNNTSLFWLLGVSGILVQNIEQVFRITFSLGNKLNYVTIGDTNRHRYTPTSIVKKITFFLLVKHPQKMKCSGQAYFMS